jgi:hypothetical protein
LLSLTYNLNLNLNQEMKKIKESLLNKTTHFKTTHFKTSNHVEIYTKIKDLLHDFDKILLTY